MSCGSFSEPDLSSFLEFSSAGGGRHCHALISFHFFSLLVPCSRPVELFTASPSQHRWEDAIVMLSFLPLVFLPAPCSRPVKLFIASASQNRWEDAIVMPFLCSPCCIPAELFSASSSQHPTSHVNWYVLTWSSPLFASAPTLFMPTVSFHLQNEFFLSSFILKMKVLSLLSYSEWK